MEVGEDGEWLVPVLYGVDAESEAGAEAYGVDHNASVLGGGDYSLTDHMRMWEGGFVGKLAEMVEAGSEVVSYDAEDVGRLVAWERREREKGEVEKLPVVRPPVVKVELSEAEAERWAELKGEHGLDDGGLFRVLLWGWSGFGEG